MWMLGDVRAEPRDGVRGQPRDGVLPFLLLVET
jgi:hypothetical protein